jgi:hypothetical protein
MLPSASRLRLLLRPLSLTRIVFFYPPIKFVAVRLCVGRLADDERKLSILELDALDVRSRETSRSDCTLHIVSAERNAPAFSFRLLFLFLIHDHPDGGADGRTVLRALFGFVSLGNRAWRLLHRLRRRLRKSPSKSIIDLQNAQKSLSRQWKIDRAPARNPAE